MDFDLDLMLRALGREIAAQRTRAGLTQRELAEAAGLTPRQMGKVERGERGQVSEAWKIANALGLDFSRLVRDAEQEAIRRAR